MWYAQKVNLKKVRGEPFDFWAGGRRGGWNIFQWQDFFFPSDQQRRCFFFSVEKQRNNYFLGVYPRQDFFFHFIRSNGTHFKGNFVKCLPSCSVLPSLADNIKSTIIVEVKGWVFVAVYVTFRACMTWSRKWIPRKRNKESTWSTCVLLSELVLLLQLVKPPVIYVLRGHDICVYELLCADLFKHKSNQFYWYVALNESYS